MREREHVGPERGKADERDRRGESERWTREESDECWSLDLIDVEFMALVRQGGPVLPHQRREGKPKQLLLPLVLCCGNRHTKRGMSPNLTTLNSPPVSLTDAIL